MSYFDILIAFGIITSMMAVLIILLKIKIWELEAEIEDNYNYIDYLIEYRKQHLNVGFNYKDYKKNWEN